MKRLLLVDGNSMIFRAYYATAYGQKMTSSSGLPTNAVYGFINMLQKAIDEVNPEAVMVAFDAGKHTFRHELYPDYKGGRQETPEDLIPQFKLVRDMLDAMNIKWMERKDIEADDLIGTTATINNKYETHILTSDRDMLQLIDDHTHVLLMRKGISEMADMTQDALEEELGINSNQIIDMKGLMGDKSDNIPGIAGVGEKTAIKLLQEYGSLENILEHTDELKGALQKKIIDGKELAILSKQLATIKRDVDLDFTIEELDYKPDYKNLITFLQSLDMKSLSKKYMAYIEDDIEETKVINHYSYTKEISLDKFKEGAAIFVNDDRNHYLDANINGIAIANDTEAYYIKIEDIKNNIELLNYLKDEKIIKIGFDIKRNYHCFENEGIEVAFSDDAMILATLIDSTLTSNEKINNKYDLYLSANYEDVYGKTNKPILLIEEDKECAYGIENAKNIYSIYRDSIDKIEEYEMTKLYRDVELPLSKILFAMENEGIRCDENVLDSIANDTYQKMESEQEEIYKQAGHEFNINSPKQLGEVLFDELNLPTDKKRSTSADRLEKLEGYHPIIEHILIYRKLTKLYSTYAEGLKKYICKDGKIHTIYNQCATQTGRLSSSDPNLQNISVRDEQGREIRKAFLPEEGSVLISSDYHQVELRIIADMANEKSLIKAFKDGIDIHTKTAMDVFGKKEDEVTSADRRKAKAVNFGIVYGISDFGLAEQIGTTRWEAKEFIDAYYKAYPGIKTYMDSVIDFCEKNGYVLTLLNRRRAIPEIHDKNYAIREFGKRAAMNAPIQGTAADLIKLAMIDIDKEMKKAKVKSKMILQVHDELIFNVLEDEIEIMKKIINKGMESAMSLKVPLTSECAIGSSWYEAK